MHRATQQHQRASNHQDTLAPLRSGRAGLPVATLLFALSAHGPVALAASDVIITRPTPAPLSFGEGRFALTRTPAAVSSIVSADFNGDGNPDLAWLSDPNSNREPDWGDSVTVALGMGDGRFVEHVILTTPGGELLVQDFNGDGNPDLAIAGDTIVLRYNLGNAQFAPPEDTGIEAAYNTELGLAVTAADVDNDSDPDLILTDAEGRLDVAINTGGQFTIVSGSRSFLADDRPRLLDFNADGLPDMVYLQSPGSIVVRRGLGDGTFSDIPSTTLIGYSNFSVHTPSPPGPPLVTATVQSTGTVRVFADDAVTGLNPIPVLELPTGQTDGLPRLLDLDADNELDLLIGGRVCYSALITAGTGRTATLTPPLTVGSPPGAFESNNGPGFLLVDVNHDNAPDHVEPGYVRLSLRDENILPRLGHRTVGPTLDVHSHLAAADLDADGNTDLVAAGFNELELRFGRPPGPTGTETPLGPPISLPHGLDDFSGLITLLIDLDGDTRPDIVTLDRNPRVVSFLNLGNRQFAQPQSLELTDGFSDLTGIAAADLDGDSDPDLVVSNDADDELVVLRNTGGVLSVAQRLALPAGDYNTVAVLDYNGDTHPDAIIGDASDNRLLFANGSPDGTLTLIGYLYVPAPPYWLTTTDANSDGIDDLLVTTRDPDDGYSPILVWHRSAEGPIDLIPVEIPTTYPALEAFCTDLDGDGNNDLVTAQTVRDKGAIIVYDGTPVQGAWPEPQRFSTTLVQIDEPFPAAVIAPDLNADGTPDLAWTGKQPRLDLAMQNPSPMGPCRVDMQGDAVVDSGDIATFIELFIAQHPAADLNRDTVIDLADIQLFVDKFQSGC
ncbi:MAG: hypothetical protein ACI89L_001685 [Phycisphaerales bacterium]|jgi:hypothetical protein